MDFPILSFLVFFPVIGAIILLFIPSKRESDIKAFCIFISTIIFGVSLPVFFGYPGTQFVEHYEWIDRTVINTTFYLKVDGINILLVLLTTFITPITLIASWNSIKKRVKEFCIMMLFLETGMIGALLSFDLLLFYFFWEIMLIPMYFIIGVWGSENRIYAAVKFVIFTVFGSLLMFLAIIWIYLSVEPNTFNLDVLIVKCPLELGFDVQLILFIAFALSFAIKVPMFPFHTWLPDAHVQAPTAGSVILAGILLKMGTYGFIRFAMQLFPAPTLKYADVFSILAVIGIIYGAFMALAQKDMKKLIAYSSISHLGFVMVGIFAFIHKMDVNGIVNDVSIVYQGVQGAMFQMINHGLSTGALFLLVGVIYERRHTKEIAHFGGLAKVMPKYASVFMITMLSSIGLPGLNGFVGEFLILMGTFKANAVYGILAASGVILGAVYMLWLYQRVFFGRITSGQNFMLEDLNTRELFYFIPIIILFFLLGIFPEIFLSKINDSLLEFTSRMHHYFVNNLVHLIK